MKAKAYLYHVKIKSPEAQETHVLEQMYGENYFSRRVAWSFFQVRTSTYDLET